MAASRSLVVTTTEGQANVALPAKCEIAGLSSRFRHTVHAYYDKNPWNEAETRLLYVGFDTDGKGHIVVRELSDGTEHSIATTNRTNYHDAAGQQWIFNDTAVVFHRDRGDGQANTSAHQVPCIAPVSGNGEVRELTELPGRLIRMVCADGEHALAFAMDSVPGPTIERINLRTQSSDVIITAAEAVQHLPDSLLKPGWQHHFSHPVFNHDESRLFFKLMHSPPDGGFTKTSFCAFFVMDLPEGHVRCLGNDISGHPSWLPDGDHILNMRHPRDGSDNRWLVSVDSRTGEYERVIDAPLEGPIHPSMSPNGRWIVTDSFTSDGKNCPIYLISTETGAVTELVRLPYEFKGGRREKSDIQRANPHPVWSHSGSQVLANWNNSGERMTLVALSDLPSDPSTG